MGMDINYRIRFATAEAARIAMEAITFPEERGTSTGLYGEPMSIYERDRSGFDLSASTVPDQDNVVSMSSGIRWMSPKVLTGELSAHHPKAWSAPTVLGHLEFLMAQEALAGATILYGADSSMAMEDFVTVDEDFMKRLREVVVEQDEVEEEEED